MPWLSATADFDLAVERELLSVLMFLSMRSWMLLGTYISSPSSSNMLICFCRFFAFKGSTECANLNLLTCFFLKISGLIMNYLAAAVMVAICISLMLGVFDKVVFVLLLTWS